MDNTTEMTTSAFRLSAGEEWKITREGRLESQLQRHKECGLINLGLQACPTMALPWEESLHNIVGGVSPIFYVPKGMA